MKVTWSNPSAQAGLPRVGCSQFPWATSALTVKSAEVQRGPSEFQFVSVASGPVTQHC